MVLRVAMIGVIKLGAVAQGLSPDGFRLSD